MIFIDYTENNVPIMITISLAEYRSLLAENSELQTNILRFEKEFDMLMEDKEQWKKMYFDKCDEIKKGGKNE